VFTFQYYVFRICPAFDLICGLMMMIVVSSDVVPEAACSARGRKFWCLCLMWSASVLMCLASASGKIPRPCLRIICLGSTHTHIT